MKPTPTILSFLFYVILMAGLAGATVLTTFSDSSTSGNLTYTTGFEWYTRSLLLPPNVSVFNAYLYLTGYPSLGTGVGTATFHDFETDPYKNWTANATANITVVPTSKAGGNGNWAGEIDTLYTHYVNYFMNGDNYSFLNISILFKYVGDTLHMNGAHWMIDDNFTETGIQGVDLIWLQTGLLIQHFDGINYTTVCYWTYNNDSAFTKLTIEINNTPIRSEINFYCNDTKLYPGGALSSYTGAKPQNITRFKFGTASSGTGKMYIDDLNVSYPQNVTGVAYIYPTNVSIILESNASTVFNYGAANASSLNHKVLANLTTYLNMNASSPVVMWFRSNTTGILEYSGLYVSYGYDNYTRNANYSGVQSINGTNYSRSLVYWINLSCNGGDAAEVNLFSGGVEISKTNMNCNGSVHNYTGSYQPLLEGNRTISLYFNDTTDSSKNAWFGNDTVFFDLYAPSISTNYSLMSGFNASPLRLNMTCIDSAYTPLYYNSTLNGADVITGNFTNKTVKTYNVTTVPLVNTWVSSCADLFGNTTASYIFQVNFRELALIDERTGLAFDVMNITGAKAYFDDNSTLFDFRAVNTSFVNFTSITTSKLRIELSYLTGDIVLRYIDVSLNESSPLRICANKEGIVHYENILTSSRERGVALKNPFADCLVGIDYTRFSYQDNRILKTYTIAASYDLYLYSNTTNRSKLTSVDGSIATWIQIDVIEFATTRTQVSARGEVITFNKTSPNRVTIYYRNIPPDASKTLFEIYRMDTGILVYSSTETVSPNEITYVFDYSLLTNITNQTLFKVQTERTDSGGVVHYLKRYFTAGGGTAPLVGQVGYVIALLLSIFGLTLASTKWTFSWFGILIIIASIGILSFSIQAWYVIFLEAVDVVLLMYVGIIMWKNNNLQVT